MNIQTSVPTASNELAVMQVLTPAAVFAPGGVDDVIGKIKAEVQTIVVDISTEAGRKAIASTAYKIARSKTALDKMGKDLGESHHKAWKAITTERSRIATELDALKDEFRKPLTDWENAEKDRVAAHEAELAAIVEAPGFGQNETAAELRSRMNLLLDYPERDWQEFSDRALATIETEIDRTRKLLAAAEKREADAAELARLRQEQVDREQRERDERIAREAAERARAEAEEKAERERQEAERKAQAEREAAARREQEAREAAEGAEAQRKEAEAKAEESRKNQHEFALQSLCGMISDACSPMNGSNTIQHVSKLFETMSEHKRDWQEYRPLYDEMVSGGRKRIEDRLASVRQNEEERRQKAEMDEAAAARKREEEAAERAERDRVAAVEVERQRVADEHAAAAAEVAKREANKRHCAKVNSAAREALVAAGLTAGQATTAITAIAKGTVPNVKISY